MTPPTAEAAIRQDRLIAIVRAASAAKARELAGAARDAGIRCIEITFSVPGCPELVAELASKWSDSIIGVGTVLSAAEVSAAAAAGAQFAVSPNVDQDVIRAARDLGLCAVPGASSPTEIVAAWRAGASLVKVFPCKTLGGPEYIRLVRGPLPAIPLVCTGGVTVSSVAAYLEAGAVAVGATTDLFVPDLVESGDLGAISARGRRFREAAHGAPRA